MSRLAPQGMFDTICQIAGNSLSKVCCADQGIDALLNLGEDGLAHSCNSMRPAVCTGIC